MKFGQIVYEFKFIIRLILGCQSMPQYPSYEEKRKQVIELIKITTIGKEQIKECVRYGISYTFLGLKYSYNQITTLCPKIKL